MKGSTIININYLKEIGYTLNYDIYNDIINAKYNKKWKKHDILNDVDFGNLFTEVGRASITKYKLEINSILLSVYGMNGGYFIKINNLKGISDISWDPQEKIVNVYLYNNNSNLLLDNDLDKNTRLNNNLDVYIVNDDIINLNYDNLKKVYFTSIYHDYILDSDIIKKNLVYTLKNNKFKRSYDSKYNIKKDTIEGKLYYNPDDYFSDSKGIKFKKIIIEKIELYDKDSIVTIENENYEDELMFFTK